METALGYVSNMVKHCDQMLMKEELVVAAEGPSHQGSIVVEQVQ